MGRAETGEGRNEVDAAGVLNRTGKRLALAGVCEEAETVVQPLNRRARDEDGTLECVLALTGGRCRDDSVRRIGRRGSSMHEHEGSGPKGRLRLAGTKAGLP